MTKKPSRRRKTALSKEIDDAVSRIELELDRTARLCLRLSSNRTLRPEEYYSLAKWIFGCMNQRFTIRERVATRGVSEFEKILQFIDRAYQTCIYFYIFYG
jgi:hypothetical protein